MSDNSIPAASAPGRPDPQETAEWRAFRLGDRRRRPGPRPIPARRFRGARPPSAHRLGAAARALRQLDSGRPPAAPSPRSSRSTAAHDHAVEHRSRSSCAPNQAGTAGGQRRGVRELRERRRGLFEVGFDHFFRARTQAFGGDLVFYPAALCAGCLRPRLPRGPARRRQHRWRTSAARSSRPRRDTRPEQLSAPVADAGLLAVPQPARSADQLDLPGARFMRFLQHRRLLDTAAARSRHVRRRRDGRARGA